MVLCENHYELSCYMSGGEFLDKLIDCWLSKKDSVRFQKCCNLCFIECVIRSEKQQFK